MAMPNRPTMSSMRGSMSLLRTAEGARTSATDARAQFSIFAFLLALAILFHQARLGDWELLSSHMAVSLAAIFVLVRPSSPPRFFAMLAIQLASLLIDMPYVVNHWLLLGLTTVGLAAGLALAAVRRRRWLSDPGEIYRRVAPVVRIQVVLVYLVAALAKLNTDFLDPALSCGAAMSGDLLASGPISLHGAWQDVPAIAGTLLIEALLPVALLVRRTRVAAVLVGAGFHTVLAIAGHVPFSGFAFAFYALFLPDDLPRRLRGVLDAAPELRTVAARAQRSPAGGWPSRCSPAGGSRPRSPSATAPTPSTQASCVSRSSSSSPTRRRSERCCCCACAGVDRAPTRRARCGSRIPCGRSPRCWWCSTPQRRTSASRPRARSRCTATCRPRRAAGTTC